MVAILIPDGAERVWVALKDDKEVGVASTLKELTDTFGKRGVVFATDFRVPGK